MYWSSGHPCKAACRAGQGMRRAAWGQSKREDPQAGDSLSPVAFTQRLEQDVWAGGRVVDLRIQQSCWGLAFEWLEPWKGSEQGGAWSELWFYKSPPRRKKMSICSFLQKQNTERNIFKNGRKVEQRWGAMRTGRWVGGEISLHTLDSFAFWSR